jgi:hypothetical protein
MSLPSRTLPPLLPSPAAKRPHSIQLEDLGERCELLSGVNGKAPAAYAFYALCVRGLSPRCKNCAGAEAPVAPTKSAPMECTDS